MTQIADLVMLFYNQLWNQKNFAIAHDILSPLVHFRGSLGSAVVGRDKVVEYVEQVTTSLNAYTCEIQELVSEGNKAAAKVLFRGTHVKEFMGYEPTGKVVQWVGAAFFDSSDNLLTGVWVLGDLQGLMATLDSNRNW